MATSVSFAASSKSLAVRSWRINAPADRQQTWVPRIRDRPGGPWCLPPLDAAGRRPHSGILRPFRNRARPKMPKDPAGSLLPAHDRLAAGIATVQPDALLA